MRVQSQWTRLLLFFSFGLMSACVQTPNSTALTPEGARVRVSTVGHVIGCEYLGDFWGTVGRGGPTWARNIALNHAAARGATDVVFDERDGVVGGRGYMCR